MRSAIRIALVAQAADKPFVYIYMGAESLETWIKGSEQEYGPGYVPSPEIRAEGGSGRGHLLTSDDPTEFAVELTSRTSTPSS